MLTLGSFVFRLRTTPYQEMQLQSGWRHPSNSRVGARPSRQFAGPDDETISLQGVLYPEITGGLSSLQQLYKMAESGSSHPLVSLDGTVHGFFVIESLQRTGTMHFRDGAARKIEFTLTLKRVDDQWAIQRKASSRSAVTVRR